MKRFSTWSILLLLLTSAVVGNSQQPKKSAGALPAKTENQDSFQSSPLTAAIRANNLGLALMDQQDFGGALGKFQTACIMAAQSDVGCSNAGIALLNMRQYQQARTILTKSAERDPENPRSWFNLALLERIEGKLDAALEDFKKVAAIDPEDADAEYFMGLTYSEAGQDEAAIDAFERAVKLDPFNVSAEMGIAQAMERTNDTDGALLHLDRFRHLVAGNLGHSVSSNYGKEGKYSLAQELEAEASAVPEAIPVHFVDVTLAAGLSVHSASGPPAHGGLHAPDRTSSHTGKLLPRSGSDQSAGTPAAPTDEEPNALAAFLGSGVCVFDFDGDGKPDVFLVDADGRGNGALYRNTGRGKFEDATSASNIRFHGVGTGCATGDYDNDGRIDLALSSSSGVTLYHNEGAGKFMDVTRDSGIRADGLSLGLEFVDADRDGHLDLYVSRFNHFPLGDPRQPFAFADDVAPPGNILWHNKGNGTFENRTKDAQLAGSAASTGVVATDVNNDGTIDFVLTGWRKSPELLLSQREGPFETMSWETETPGPTAGGIAFDFDKNGWMDLAFSHWAQPCLSLWRNMKGRSFERAPLPDPGWMRAWGIAALDYDDDGWLDLVAVGETFAGEGRILLVRNEGDRGFKDVTSETGLDKVKLHNPRSIVALDYNGDGTADLLITQNGLPPVLLKNEGGNKNGWIELALNGSVNNRAGIGAKIHLFSGAQRQKWEVSGASGYLGQGSPEILAGLGRDDGADVLRIVWPNGVTQDEMQIRGGSRMAITETDRSASPRP